MTTKEVIELMKQAHLLGFRTGVWSERDKFNKSLVTAFAEDLEEMQALVDSYINDKVIENLK